MRVGDVNFGETATHGPRMADRRPTVHHNDEGTFTAKKVDKQLEECIDCKGLELASGTFVASYGWNLHYLVNVP